MSRRICLARRLAAACLVLGAAGLATGCAVDREPNVEFLPWLNPMMFSQAAESQAPNSVLRGGMVQQAPPTGTIPRGFVPYRFANNEAAIRDAEKSTPSAHEALLRFAKRPTYGKSDEERGAELFTRFCSPCHGTQADGKGPVALKAPTIGQWQLADLQKLTDSLQARTGNKDVQFSDVRIFHKITFGADPDGGKDAPRAVMPSYASQISQEDRWRIVLHVRKLQAAFVAAPEPPAAPIPAPAVAPAPAPAPVPGQAAAPAAAVTNGGAK